jgi:NAD(P)H-hydrate epimerase
MKLLSAAQIKLVEEVTLNEQGITSLQLMERAAHACLQWCLQHIPRKETVYLLCGRGNNGGDGLALARKLQAEGQPVVVCRLPGAFSTEEARAQAEQLLSLGVPVAESFPMVPPGAWVIDALLGHGLQEPARGVALDWIEALNAAQGRVISIDLPSGLPEDPGLWNRNYAVVHAAYTLALEMPKRSMFVPETGVWCGQVAVLPLDLSQQALEDQDSSWFFVDLSVAQSLYRQPGRFDHKGSYGHALVVGGSAGSIGAVVLATQAALRAGAGKVTALVPQAGEMVVHMAVPEALTQAVGDKHITAIPLAKPYDAIGLGPGLGTHPETAQAVKLLLQEWTHPLVLDADALNILAQNPTWLAFLPPGSILTPHLGEWYRLVGRRCSGLEALAEARQMALRFGIYIVLKGHRSCVSTPTGAQWFNSTGNPGMATAGSGDVLTGVITGLLARGYTPFDAAVLGMYLHGASGDALLQHQGMESITAGDLVQGLKSAWKVLDPRYP